MKKVIKKLTKKKSATSSATKKTPAKTKKTPAKTKKAATIKKNTTAKKISSSEFFSMVEAKAYEIYAKRGYFHGEDQKDWFEAEKLLKAKLSK